jgi:hypothetical protein
VALSETEVLPHQLGIPSGARQHYRTLYDPNNVARQSPRIYGLSRSVFLRSRIQIRLELHGHFVETLREPKTKLVVGVAQSGAQIADDAAALSPHANHFLDGIETHHQPLKWIGVRGGTLHALFDPLQILPAFVHMRLNDSEPKIFFAFEVVKECAGGHFGAFKNILQLRVVIALQGKKARRFHDNFVSGCHRPGLLEFAHFVSPVPNRMPALLQKTEASICQAHIFNAENRQTDPLLNYWPVCQL